MLLKDLTLNFIRKFVFGLFGLLIGILFLFSISRTCTVNIDEIIFYHHDFPLLHIVYLVLLCLLLTRFCHQIRSIPPVIFYGIPLVFMLLWILSTCLYPKADQILIYTFAKHIAEGNYQDFLPGGYLYCHPHQIFLTYFSSALYLLFGEFYIFIFQLLNAAAVLGIFYFLQKIYKRLDASDSPAFFQISCIFFLPLMLYVTFLYGTLLGLFFVLWATDFFAAYMETHSLSSILLCTLLILLAQFFKSNYLIFAIGFLAILLYDFMKRINFRHILFAGILIVSFVFCSHCMTSFTEHLTGVRSEGGIPKILYVAMGLQESDLACGWYNGYNYNLFLFNNCDVELCEKKGKKNIEERLEIMKNDPDYGADFFLKKTLSQWCEPTYESLWIQQKRESQITIPFPINALIDNGGRLSDAYMLYCNFFQSFLYFGALMFVCKHWKNISSYGLWIPTIFIGGFIFHFFWEAKGQYTLPYCVCLLPCSISGYRYITERLHRLVFKK